MSAIPPDNGPRCVATRRNALRAVKAAATGASITVVLAGTAVPAAAAEPGGNCGAPSVFGIVTCVYDKPTVTNYVLRVSPGVTEVHIEARGAGGGNGGVIESGRPAPRGGRGGVVSADFPVATGGLLHILVGGRGRNADGMNPGVGGLNGGGKGGAGALGGGGGGGASSVLLNGNEHASRILVAGGGGGAGGAMTSTAATSASGGFGGGERGGHGSGDIVGKGGRGATGPSGGAALHRITGLDGHSGYDAWWGGHGGEGGYGPANKSLKHSGTWATGPLGAGGGGGGYAGGGGGAAGPTVGGGGGGGSGFVATSALAPSVARLGTAELSGDGSGSLGDGSVVITYQLPTDQQDRAEATVIRGGSGAATSNGRRRS